MGNARERAVEALARWGECRQEHDEACACGGWALHRALLMETTRASAADVLEGALREEVQWLQASETFGPLARLGRIQRIVALLTEAAETVDLAKLEARP